MEGEKASVLRRIPGVGVLLQEEQVREICRQYPHALVAAVLGDLTAELRRLLREGGSVDDPREWLLARLSPAVAVAARSLRRVLNATGVTLHTNLGRAPLATEAVEAISELGRGYCNLEFELETGERGSRYVHAVGLLRLLTGAEDALVVNNNAAAVLLCLAALARGRQVLVSRGELVEIGGGFRIPEIMAESGAFLVEVGTTNRTRLADYERALSPEVALLLKVHRSNFRLEGFVSEVSWEELARWGRSRGIPVMFDLGSGSLFDLASVGIGEEPEVSRLVAWGGDLVTFSGDKLLGGPQAGIILGRRELLARLRTHPLLRALRVDKLTLAALSATLLLHLEPERAREKVPVLKALLAPPQELRRKARRLQRLLRERGDPTTRGARFATVAASSPAGGGALPGVELPTYAVSVAWEGGAAQLAARLRSAPVPVVARVHGEQVWLDMRSLSWEELPAVADMVWWALTR